LTVNSVPVFVQQPTSVGACAGLGTLQFEIIVSGGGPYTYQWRKNGIDLQNDAIYTGVNTAILEITAPPISENGAQFDVVVSGICSPPVAVSDVATLTVDIFAPEPAPVSASKYIICDGDFITLNGTAHGFTIDWYTQPTGGSSIVSSASGVNSNPVYPANNTAYYAESRIGGCVSSRVFVGTVYVTTPNPPFINYAPPAQICQAGQVTLTSNTCTPGEIKWYDSPNACVPIFSG